MSFNQIGERETLPEKVSKIIKESILNGELKGGEILPTEPELEKQFSVSRAVIRDAISILKGQGLIDVKHGKGMYVSQTHIKAFTDSLLTSLRRDQATVWDVEQFEQMFLPEVFALAAVEASDQEIEVVREKCGLYLNSFEKMNIAEKEKNKETLDSLDTQCKSIFEDLMISLFNCTHNKMVILIGTVTLTMRQGRTVMENDESNLENELLDIERKAINRFLEALESRDPQVALKLIQEVYKFNSNIKEIFKNTVIGKSPEIPQDIFIDAFNISPKK